MEKNEAQGPTFVLHAADPASDALVQAWVALKTGEVEGAVSLMYGALDVLTEAGALLEPDDLTLVVANRRALEMRQWRERQKSRLGGG